MNGTSTDGHWCKKFKIKIKNLFSKLVKKCKKRNLQPSAINEQPTIANLNEGKSKVFVLRLNLN